MVGYGYIYTNGGKVIEDDLRPSLFLLSWVLIISTIVLGLSLILLCNMAYGFRRDQFVNNRIRKKMMLIHNKNEEDNIFPKSYDPAWSFNEKTAEYDKKLMQMNLIKRYTVGLWTLMLKRLVWMPNFHNYLFFMLYLIQLLIFSSYFFNPFDDIVLIDFNLDVNWVFTVTVFMWLILNVLMLRPQVVFYNRLKKLYQ